MMVLNLNLLPEKNQHDLRLLARLTLVKNIFGYSLLILLALLVFLSLVHYILIEQFSNLTASVGQVLSRSYAHYNREVKTINQKINSVNAAGGKSGMLTPRLILLLNATPPDIQLKNLSFGLNTTEISLPGAAKTRDGLLAYEEILKKIPWVTAVELPKSQLLQKEKIDFQITLRVKPPDPNE